MYPFRLPSLFVFPSIVYSVLPTTFTTNPQWPVPSGLMIIKMSPGLTSSPFLTHKDLHLSHSVFTCPVLNSGLVYPYWLQYCCTVQYINAIHHGLLEVRSTLFRYF